MSTTLADEIEYKNTHDIKNNTIGKEKNTTCVTCAYSYIHRSLEKQNLTNQSATHQRWAPVRIFQNSNLTEKEFFFKFH